MSTSSFSIGDIINESWAAIKKNVWLFVAVVLGYGLISFLVSMLFNGTGAAVSYGASSDPAAILASVFTVSYFLSMLVMLAISAIFYIGYYKMALDAADGLTPQLSAFSNASVKKILNLFIGNIIYAIAVYLGFILCIVPGIFLAVRLQFYIFFIVENDCNAFDALAKSWECSKGESMNLILLGLAFFLVNILGAICCGVGLLVTAPMSTIGIALVYRRFVGGAPEEADFESLSDTPIV